MKKQMNFYQITFKNGGTMEFATFEVADGYAENFGLATPVLVVEEIEC